MAAYKQKHSYRKYIGKAYEEPHGCFALVREVYEDLYRIDLGPQDEGLDPNNVEDRILRLHHKLVTIGEEVKDPKEGDVILIHSFPYHMGLVIDPVRQKMLHSYANGAACIESYGEGRWRNRIAGFWRYKEPPQPNRCKREPKAIGLVKE